MSHILLLNSDYKASNAVNGESERTWKESVVGWLRYPIISCPRIVAVFADIQIGNLPMQVWARLLGGGGGGDGDVRLWDAFYFRKNLFVAVMLRSAGKLIIRIYARLWFRLWTLPLKRGG